MGDHRRLRLQLEAPSETPRTHVDSNFSMAYGLVAGQRLQRSAFAPSERPEASRRRNLVPGGLAHAVAAERQLRKASLSWATWAASLASPAATNAAVVPDRVRLTEAQEMGLVHRSLLEPPGELAA